MRLNELMVEEFKNLQQFRITFDQESPYTVLVGENGSGKSNLIEAVATIFRNLDLDVVAPFTYRLRYTCRHKQLEIYAQKDQWPRLGIRNVGDDSEFVDLPRRQFVEAVDDYGRPLYRPAFVFGYYSGPSDRLATLFDRHRERYYAWIIKPAEERLDRLADSNALRRLFYAQTLHGQFALLAFFMAGDDQDRGDRDFLREHLQIDGLDSVLFALKRPPWRRNGGDARFWNAEGEVRDFLERLYSASIFPARMERRIPIDLTKNPSVECLYLFLPTAEALGKVYASYPNQYAFFTALESTYISKLLAEVRSRVRMAPGAGGGEVTYRDLSEGEQQLLLVLGLLKFTAEDEALFLLDEPDTHLNPAWSTRYLEFLSRFIQQRDTCHIIMSTHDPLVFAGLSKSEVRVFHRDSNGCAQVDAPLQDPKGMGVQAILTSDLFRLRTTLDAATQKDLDTQRRLSQKPGDLSLEEEAELRDVNAKLESLGFLSSNRDPLISLFLRKWTERERPEWSTSADLTPAQVEERDSLASDIVDEIAAELSAPPSATK